MTATPPGSNRDQKGLPHVDYVLARRRILRDFRRGILTRLDVCDAHPELLRVAENYGEKTARDCPICADEDKQETLLK
mgnify:FL=1